MRKFLAVLKARTMEFVRDRGTFVWNLLFPILMVSGFAFAFSGDGKTLFKVALIGDRAALESREDAASRAMRDFLSIPQISVIPYGDARSPHPSGTIIPVKKGATALETAIDRLGKHQLDMVVDLEGRCYWVNDRSAGSAIVARLLRAESAGAATAAGNATAAGTAATAGTATADPAKSADSAASATAAFAARAISGDSIRYVDWLVPGVIGMNMMFSCLFGVGFVLVRYRKNGVLKRLKATPVGALNFLAAQAVSRFLIAFATSIVVYAGTNAFLKFRMEGSWFLLAALLALAILSMITLGLLFAARFRSEELASGLINLVTFPMMIFSGVFFSLEGSPAILRTASKAFPLTHFLEASRAVMLDGAALATVWPEMAILALMSAGFLAVATALFKWE